MKHSAQTDRQADKGTCPAVSVIVPAYNTASYVADCLASITGQSFRDVEIFVIDDGSTDGTGEAAASFAKRDAHIRVIRRRWNCGMAAAENLGLTLARGRYILMVDADDVLAPGMLARLFAEARLTGADVVAGGYQAFTHAAGDGPAQAWTQQPCWLGATPEERLRTVAPLRVHIAQWGKLYRKSFLDRHRIAFAHAPIAPDLAFHVKCLLAAKRYRVLPQIVYHYRRQPSSLDHMAPLARVEKYGAALPGILGECAEWLAHEPLTAGKPALRQQALQTLYVFCMAMVQNAGRTAGRALAYEHFRASLCAAVFETGGNGYLAALLDAFACAAIRTDYAPGDMAPLT